MERKTEVLLCIDYYQLSPGDISVEKNPTVIDACMFLYVVKQQLFHCKLSVLWDWGAPVRALT